MQELNKCNECRAGCEKIVIKYDGKVYPCEAFKEAPFSELFVLGDCNDLSLEKLRYSTKVLLNFIKWYNAILGGNCPAQTWYDEHPLIMNILQDLENPVKCTDGNACSAKAMISLLGMKIRELQACNLKER